MANWGISIKFDLIFLPGDREFASNFSENVKSFIKPLQTMLYVLFSKLCDGLSLAVQCYLVTYVLRRNNSVKCRGFPFRLRCSKDGEHHLPNAHPWMNVNKYKLHYTVPYTGQ